jgi:hypothetical protein
MVFMRAPNVVDRRIDILDRSRASRLFEPAATAHILGGTEQRPYPIFLPLDLCPFPGLGAQYCRAR